MPTFEGWVTRLRLACSRRRKSALLTEGNGCSSWPTHTVNSDGDATENRGISLPRAARQWPTANSHDGRRPGSDETSTQGANLKRDAEQWETPRSLDKSHQPGQDSLAIQARADWATPATRDYRSDRSQKSDEEIYGKKGRPLGRQVLHMTGPESTRDSGPLWVTPQAQDCKQEGDRPNSHAVMLIQQARKLTGQKRLNPLFVAWLMGLPLGLICYEPWAMQSFQQWRQRHSELLRES